MLTILRQNPANNNTASRGHIAATVRSCTVFSNLHWYNPPQK
uniref:Uncharacterized protein n=1 Tax=Megaselia scalaris TaxID=36166 RepID=T1GRI1_MEGSC